MKYLLIIVLLLISGCANYQFGDATRTALSTAGKVVALKIEYCATENLESRAVILATIRAVDPSYDGVCTTELIEE